MASVFVCLFCFLMFKLSRILDESAAAPAGKSMTQLTMFMSNKLISLRCLRRELGFVFLADVHGRIFYKRMY